MRKITKIHFLKPNNSHKFNSKRVELLKTQSYVISISKSMVSKRILYTFAYESLYLSDFSQQFNAAVVSDVIFISTLLPLFYHKFKSNVAY